MSVLDATQQQLEAIDKLKTPLGETALALAYRIDLNEDPGSAMAAMAKELRAIMTEIGRGATAVADPIDELKKRRERRLSG